MRLRTLVTTSAIAALAVVPLAAQTQAPASAASDRTWNRLAECESGGRWHIDTGNGYYGGLQISKSTWDAFGGRRLAAYPDNASRAEQVRVAERIQDGQGWGAWPACSAELGLT